MLENEKIKSLENEQKQLDNLEQYIFELDSSVGLQPETKIELRYKIADRRKVIDISIKKLQSAIGVGG